MNFRRQAELALRLSKNTFLGKLEWKDSPRDDAFQVSFRDYTVRMSVKPVKNAAPDYVIEVVTENGEIADTFSDRDLINALELRSVPEFTDVKWFDLMEEMYNTARRVVLGADKALDAILDELKSGDMSS